MNSKLREELSRKLGIQVSGLDMPSKKHSGISLREALHCVFSACYVLIATMNARRKDEVLHKKIGIYQGYIRIIDRELKLYEGEFYIEKTYLDYLPFYVNNVTFDATCLLERIQSCFDNVDFALGRPTLAELDERERSLFSFRRISKQEGISADRCWYDFTVRKGGFAYKFVRFALVLDFDFAPKPHMFRRFYALIYYYQYQNATLYALTQQFGHFSLSGPITYITDPTSRSEAERIKNKIDLTLERRKRAFELHAGAINKELRQVSDEVLGEAVYSIVNENSASGGYVRFIRYLYRVLCKKADFSALSNSDQVGSLVSLAKSRGHYPEPMPHGFCMAGETKSIHLARCKNKLEGGFGKENANPALCANCVYHFASEGYLNVLENDLAVLESQLNVGSILERAITKQNADNLAKVIYLHRKRIASHGN